MIVATTENIAGHRVRESFGQCFGVVVRSRGIGGNGGAKCLRCFRRRAGCEQVQATLRK